MEDRLAEFGLVAALGLGVILGLKHSLDPDHLVAVSTIVSEYRNPMRSFWIGISWGLGHTTTLFLLGVFIIALRLAIPNRLALLMEFSVGIMLVGLGLQVIYNLRKKKVHQHLHGHEEKAHHHFHSHAQHMDHKKDHHQGWGIGKPFLRKKSYFVGTVHGVAGSAVLTLLVLASIESPLASMIYIFLFGMGSVISMGVMTIVIGLPFSLSSKHLPHLNKSIQLSAGTLSILFGFFLMYEISFVNGLF